MNEDRRGVETNRLIVAARLSAGSVAICGSSVYVAAALVGHFSGLRFSDRTTLGLVDFSVIWIALAIGLLASLWLASSSQRSSSMRVLSGRCAPDGAGTWRKQRALNSRARLCAAYSIGLVSLLAIYRAFVEPGALAGGDWQYQLNPAIVKSWFPVPSLWLFTGLGRSNSIGATQFPLLALAGLLARLGLSFAVTERIVWFLPAVIAAYTGMFLLLGALRASLVTRVIIGLLFAINPYIALLLSGGQPTVALGFGMLPWVGLAAIRAWREPSVSRGLQLGLVLAVQGWADPRWPYLSVISIFVSIVVMTIVTRATLKWSRLSRRLPAAGASALSFVLLQAQWLLPSLAYKRAALPTGFTSASALKALSYFSLGDGLGAFHPLWTHNNPSALGALPPIFAVIPAVVAVPLFARRAEASYLVGLAIYLVFSALLVGANEPFGALNIWLFSHIPGMSEFRDPSPYLGVAIGGVCLALGTRLPVNPHARDERSLGVIGHKLHSDSSAAPSTAVLASVVAVLLFVAIPMTDGGVGGNLVSRRIPPTVESLFQFSKRAQGATLWVPSPPNYVSSTAISPELSAYDLGTDSHIAGPWHSVTGSPISWLYTNRDERWFSRLGIRYVIVSDDRAAYTALGLSPASAAEVKAALTGLAVKRIGAYEIYSTGIPLADPVSSVPAGSVLSLGRVNVATPLSYPEYNGYSTVVSSRGGVDLPFSSVIWPNGAAELPGTSGERIAGGTISPTLVENLNEVGLLQVEVNNGIVFARVLPLIQTVSVGGERLTELDANTLQWTRVGEAPSGNWTLDVRLRQSSQLVSMSGQKSSGPLSIGIYPVNDGRVTVAFYGESGSGLRPSTLLGQVALTIAHYSLHDVTVRSSPSWSYRWADPLLPTKLTMVNSRFGDGTDGWSAAYGIAHETVVEQYSSKSDSLTLSSSGGPVTVAHSFEPWIETSSYRLTIKYKTWNGTNVLAAIFVNGQDAPVGLSRLTSTNGRWRTRSLTVDLPSSALPAGSNAELAVSGQPEAARGARWALGAIRLTQQVPVISIAEIHVPDLATRTAATHVLNRLGTGPFQVQLSKPSGPQLLVLWQTYDSGWHADIGGKSLLHVVVNGWANGFVVGRNSSGQIAISFVPQRIEGISMLMVAAALTTTVMFIAIARIGRRRSSKLSRAAS